MDNFDLKKYLVESRLFKESNSPSILYHFTTPKGLIGILNSNKLKSHNSFNQVSFTEDPDLWAFQEFPDSDQEIGVRLTFKSSNLPKLKPFTYQGAPGEFLDHEKEWITTSGDIIFNPPIEEQILDGDVIITAQEYWKKWLQDNMEGPLYPILNIINWD